MSKGTWPACRAQASPGVTSPGFVREDHRLHAVAHPELHQHVRHVRLDRRVADHEVGSDLRVRAPAREQQQHLALALGELLQTGRAVGLAHRRPAGELGDHRARHRRSEQRGAACDDADRVEQLLGRRVLEHEAAGTGAQRVEHVLVQAERREHQHPHVVAQRRDDAARGLDAVELGHADVEHGDVRLAGPRGIDGLQAVSRLRDHGQVGLGLDDLAQAPTDQRLIVGLADPDHGESPA